MGLSRWTVAKPRPPQRWSRWGVVQRGRGLGGCSAYPCFKLSLCRAQVCLLRCSLLSSLLLLLLRIHETEQNSYCQQIITERHLAELEELVSALPGLCGGMGAHLGASSLDGQSRLLFRAEMRKRFDFQLPWRSDGTWEPSIRGHKGQAGAGG